MEKFRLLYVRDRLELDRGTIDAEHYWERILQAAGVASNHGLIEHIEREDALGWMRVNQRVVDWSAELRDAGYRTSILSNMPTDKLSFMRASGMMDWIGKFESQQEHPDVLELRWSISAEEKRWEEGLQVAQTLLRRAPKRSSGWLHQAYALRRVPDGGVQKAWEALLPAFDKFPKELLIPFNLSCYACQMRQLDTARDWLQRAVESAARRRSSGWRSRTPIWSRSGPRYEECNSLTLFQPAA